MKINHVTQSGYLAGNTDMCESARSILDTAETLFSEKDFDAVSINDIAGKVGVSKANIFHHFQSKEKLYLAVLKNACARSASALDLVNPAPSGNPLKQMNEFFSGHLQVILSEPQSTQLIQRELLENGEKRGKLLAEEVFTDTFSNVVNLVSQAQNQGMVRQGVDPSLLAFIMIGSNAFYFETRDVLEHMPAVSFNKSPEKYSAAVFDLLINGFK